MQHLKWVFALWLILSPMKSEKNFLMSHLPFHAQSGISTFQRRFQRVGFMPIKLKTSKPQMIEAEIVLHTWNSWQSPWLVLHTAILHTEEQDCHTHASCRGRNQHWHRQCGCKVSTVTTFQNVHPLSDSSSRNKHNRKAYLRFDSSFTQPLYSAVHEGLAFSHK